MAARRDLHALCAHQTWFIDETEAFIEWLEGRLSDNAQRGPLQVMYGIDGRQELEEVSLMKAIEEQLIEDTLVRRYRVEHARVDGLPGKEGSFTACSFRALFGRAGCRWPASWELPAGLYAFATDQRGDVSGPGALGER